MCGIIPDIYALVSRESGLRFTFTAMGMSGGEAAAIKAGGVDIIGAAVNYMGSGVDGELRLTSPFMTSSTIFAGKPGLRFTSDSRLKIAVADDVSPASEENIRARYPNSEMIKFPSPAMCMDAVKNGVTDVAANNVYVIGALLQRPKYDGIVTISTTAVEEQLTMAAAAESDPRLLSILDKTIKNFNGQAVENIINAHTIGRPNAITLEDLFYKYKTTIFVMLFFLAVCLGLLCAAWEQKKKNMRLTEENAATLKNISNNINGGVITLSEMGRFCITYAKTVFLALWGIRVGSSIKRGRTSVSPTFIPTTRKNFAGASGKTKRRASVSRWSCAS
ncbi:MAG: transporter substrate-binding domain-containing protein [bacterium]|nr:transporter substrate-binding domain-containing protein [bacterium]